MRNLTPDVFAIRHLFCFTDQKCLGSPCIKAAWWPCTWGVSCPGGLGQLGISVLFWLLNMAHFQGTTFCLLGNLFCALSTPRLFHVLFTAAWFA